MTQLSMSSLKAVHFSTSTVQANHALKEMIEHSLRENGVAILPPQDVNQTLVLMHALSYSFDMTMLDPWYNKGFGGIQDNYRDFFLKVIAASGELSQHVFFWGFPEIVATFVEYIPKSLSLTCWLTWYYKNNPSVIRGWRSSQNACLHLSKSGSKLFPERFLNDKQKSLQAKGKLRYMPGPTSVIDIGQNDVIEQPLLVGFVGRDEQTGHPSQKPFKVYDQLAQMTVANGGLILDPMCGSGTIAAVAVERGFKAIVCDGSEDYIKLTEKRLGIRRIRAEKQIELMLRQIGD